MVEVLLNTCDMDAPLMTRRSTAPSLALSLVGLMIFVVTWNAVRIGSNAVVDFVMIPAALTSAATRFIRRLRSA